VSADDWFTEFEDFEELRKKLIRAQKGIINRGLNNIKNIFNFGDTNKNSNISNNNIKNNYKSETNNSSTINKNLQNKS